MWSVTKVAQTFVLVTDTYKQLTRHISYIRLKQLAKVYRKDIKKVQKKKIYMKNKRVKGWQNIDKLYAECKQVIQKNRIQCLKGIG